MQPSGCIIWHVCLIRPGSEKERLESALMFVQGIHDFDAWSERLHQEALIAAVLLITYSPELKTAR
jgi:hypothetical protein